MTPGRLAATAWRGRLPRRTVRLRLTLWYGGLFLAFGTALLAVTYALVVQAFVGTTSGNAFCQRPQHAVGNDPAERDREYRHHGQRHLGPGQELVQHGGIVSQR